MPPVDTTFPSTVPVAGKASYGLPVQNNIINSWFQNIMQDFCIDTFEYSTSSSMTTPLFSRLISPFPDNANYNLPWWTWYVCQFQEWRCKFDLVLVPIKHSSHRGAISVSCTLNPPSDEKLSTQFLPVMTFDISGDVQSEYVYPIPCVYAFSSKTQFENARNLTGIDNHLIPKFTLDLTHLTIMAFTPLSSSAMLPSVITFKILLRPSNLEVSHPVNPSFHRMSTFGKIHAVWNNV